MKDCEARKQCFHCKSAGHRAGDSVCSKFKAQVLTVNRVRRQQATGKPLDPRRESVPRSPAGGRSYAQTVAGGSPNASPDPPSFHAADLGAKVEEVLHQRVLGVLSDVLSNAMGIFMSGMSQVFQQVLTGAVNQIEPHSPRFDDGESRTPAIVVQNEFAPPTPGKPQQEILQRSEILMRQVMETIQSGFAEMAKSIPAFNIPRDSAPRARRKEPPDPPPHA